MGGADVSRQFAAQRNGAAQPHGKTEYGSGAGYEYEDDMILGFTHTNKGHWNLCNIPILPLSKPGSTPYASHFSHQKESATPGFYQVYLDDYNVGVKLTSTLRCGYHQYAFRDNANRQVLFDLGRANNRVSGWRIEQAGPMAVQGFQQTGERIYFYARLNAKVDRIERKDDGKRNGNAVVYLADGGTQPVELKIGLSFVSVENAKANLDAEIADKSFETIRNEATQTWENLLSSVQVKGGTDKQQQMLYSCLYRSCLWPALRSDVNGEYTDVKKQVVKGDFRYYTEPSLWDTYRNKDVLLGLVSPTVTLDVIKSMKDVGDKKGFLPTFFHGDHGLSSIAGAYQRGITDFDINGTYQIMLKNANSPDGPRAHLAEYIEKGFISEPDIPDPQVETKASAGVSKTLEYSYDDYSVAQIAKILGDTTNYRIHDGAVEELQKHVRPIDAVHARPPGRWQLDYAV